jgi:hypothetical protein
VNVVAVGGWAIHVACIRRREHVLSVRRWVWPSWRPISMPPSSARLKVCVGGVEVTMILIRVSEAG